MDRIDLHILDILQSEGRITMKELGQRVGLTSPATIERVKKLEESGIVSGYKAVIDPAKAGLSVRAFIMLVVCNGRASDFGQFVREHNNIIQCHRIAGNADYLLEVAVNSLPALEKLVDEFAVFGQTHTCVVLSSPIETKPILLPA